MTDPTTAAEQRHEQAPESVPAPEVRLPPATREPDRRGHQAPEAAKPQWRAAGCGEPGAAREPVRNATNGHTTTRAAMAGARPVILPGISSETDPLVAAVCYQAWGWPVTRHGHQVQLTLHPDTVALSIPVLLAAQVTGILHRDRPPLTLIHPEAPEHWVILAGGRPEVALPWPRCVHQNTTTLPLPPTMTAHGPITWVHPPHADALHQCREFEIFAALRTALRDPPA